MDGVLDGVDVTFAPFAASTRNFTEAARMASTPSNPTTEVASLPEPPVSNIKGEVQIL